MATSLALAATHRLTLADVPAALPSLRERPGLVKAMVEETDGDAVGRLPRSDQREPWLNCRAARCRRCFLRR